MRKKVLFGVFLAFLALAASGGCATAGGYGPILPGYEAAAVTAANAAMPYQILAAGQMVQPGLIYHGQPAVAAPYGYQWACRPVSWIHELKDVVYATLGLGSVLGWRGAGGGAGGAGYIANHEKDCYLVQLQPPRPVP